MHEIQFPAAHSNLRKKLFWLPKKEKKQDRTRVPRLATPSPRRGCSANPSARGGGPLPLPPPPSSSPASASSLAAIFSSSGEPPPPRPGLTAPAAASSPKPPIDHSHHLAYLSPPAGLFCTQGRVRRNPIRLAGDGEEDGGRGRGSANRMAEESSSAKSTVGAGMHAEHPNLALL